MKQFMPVVVPGIHLSARESFTSMLRIKDEADIIIPSHDAKFLQIDAIG